MQFFCIGIDSRPQKRSAINRKTKAASKTPIEANTLPVKSGCKKKNEALPGTELMGEYNEIPKFKGSLGMLDLQETGGQGLPPDIGGGFEKGELKLSILIPLFLF